MIYTIVIFSTGVYLNQEYPDIFPSVKTIVANSIIYLKNFTHNFQQQQDKKTFIENCFFIVKKFISKNEK
jgi:hypothetical protein